MIFTHSILFVVSLAFALIHILSRRNSSSPWLWISGGVALGNGAMIYFNLSDLGVISQVSPPTLVMVYVAAVLAAGMFLFGLWQSHHLLADTTQQLDSSRERFGWLLGAMDALEEGIVAQGTDGTILSCNASAERILGAARRELIGRQMASLDMYALHEDGSRLSIQELAPTIAQATGNSCTQTVAILRPDGSRTWVVLNSQPIRSTDGNAEGVVTSLSDITARRHSEQRILLQAAALNSAANAMAITDYRGVIQWINPAFTELTGYTPAEAVGRTMSILSSGKQTAEFYGQMLETIRRGDTWQGELLNRKKDGTLYAEEQTITPVRDDTGRISHFVASKRDVTERKRQEDHIRYLATHDPLTDLPNRRALKFELERIIRDARSGKQHALLMMDLDNFKIVNDTLGHSAGDRLLVTLSRILRRSLRPSDMLVRLGGDEFSVLLEDTSLEDAQAIGERIRKEIGGFHFNLNGRVFVHSISVGIVLLENGIDSRQAQVLADAALYAAKNEGKNRVVVYRSEDDALDGLAEYDKWASQVREALARNRFELYFQPIVELGSREAERHEVLLRMVDEKGGTILPEAFLPAAERYGLMPEVDRWVLDRVFDMLAEHPELQVSVNLSGSSLSDESLLEHVERRVAQAQLGPGQLSIEVTEMAAITDLVQARRWMTRLTDSGCCFALDNFGVGLSSLSYLRSMPADCIKIDGSFVHNLDTDAGSRAIVEAIANVAHALGKKVIGKWVKNEEVARILQDMGVEYGQGYHWGRPDPDPGTLAHILKKRKIVG